MCAYYRYDEICSFCSCCTKMSAHMRILLALLDKYKSDKQFTIQAALAELKAFCWLALDLQHHIADCICPSSAEINDALYDVCVVLEKYGMELDKAKRKCDICRILPCEILSLLDEVCKQKEQENMASWYEELEYHKFLMFLYENPNGPCQECDHSIEYLSNRRMLVEFLDEKNLQSLQEKIYFWKMATNNDQILSYVESVCEIRDFRSEEIVPEDKPSAYLDFCVYDQYEKNTEVKSYMDSLVRDNKINIFCSPSHVEEIIRMHDTKPELQRMCSLQNLTKGLCVVIGESELIFCEEDLAGRLEGARRTADLNVLAENRKCIQNELRNQFFDKYKNEKVSRSVGSATLSKMLSNVDTSTQTKRYSDLPNESELDEILRYVGIGSQNIREYENLMKRKELTYRDIQYAIISLSSLFNIIGLHADKVEKVNSCPIQYPIYPRANYRTIRSGYYDTDHLLFATKCRYFVTCDEKLYKRAKEIYSYIGCETTPILLRDFMQLEF